MSIVRGVFRVRLRHVCATIARVTDNKWFLRSAIVGVFVFAAVRALPALPLTQYGFSIWVFLLIDLVTTPPYVLCINHVIRGIRTLPVWRLLVDAFVIAGAFLAPYTYLLLVTGQEMPQWALVLTLSVILGLAVVGPIRKLVVAWKGVR